jgi:type I restriction enzyme S subunit
VRLADVVEPVSTWNPEKTPASWFEYVDLSAVDQQTKSIVNPTVICGSDAPSRARQLVTTGDVLVSTVRPNLNAVAVVPAKLDGATASTGFTVLRPSSRVDSRYLFHWVRSAAFVEDMVRKATGASYPAVSDRIVKESPISLPSVDEQRRIAAILDRADSLRAEYKRSKLERGDLLMSIRGHVGRFAEVPGALAGGNITQDSARLAIDDARGGLPLRSGRDGINRLAGVDAPTH